MNSCYGYSFHRPALIKSKYTKDVESYVKTFAPYVIGYDKSNFVQTVQPVVINYTHPQLAKVILDKYKQKMDEIKTHVHVLYENIDSILVNEQDYMKLKDLGYVDDNQLGKLKIERVFTEIAILSSRKYVATLADGSKYYHCVKKDVEYDDFVNEVKMNLKMK